MGFPGRDSAGVCIRALDRTVRDVPSEPAGAVYRVLSIDPVARKDHRATDRVADSPERFILLLGPSRTDSAKHPHDFSLPTVLSTPHRGVHSVQATGRLLLHLPCRRLYR